MKLFTTCMECQIELGHPSFEPIITDYYDDSVAYIECSRSHKSAIMLQSQKFEILLESAANALLEGYTIEAASTLSAAYERFLEYVIKVFCKKSDISKEALDKTFNQVAKQSERQLGAFLFLYLIIFRNPYKHNQEITTFRNRIIHQGYIPTPEEVIKFGELIYQEIRSIIKILKADLSDEMNQVTMETLQGRSVKIPNGTRPVTTSCSFYFALTLGGRNESFREALSGYKESKKAIYGSVPYLQILSKAVRLYTNLRGSASSPDETQ
jgi:hypothetical protein